MRKSLTRFLSVYGFIIAITLLSNATVSAQMVYDLDQIRAELTLNPTDSIKVALLNQLAFELREIDQAEALEAARRAETLAATLRDTLQLAKAKGHIGWINYRMGDWEGTFRYSREAYELSLIAGDANETAMALNNLGALYYQQQDYHTAIERFREAFLHVRGTDNYFTIIRSLNNTALNFVRAEMPDSAMHYASLAMQVNKDAGSPFSLSFPYRVIGDVHYFYGDYPEAMRWYADAFRMAELRNLTSFQAGILHRKGITLMRMGRGRDAMVYLKRGEELSTRQGLRDELSTTYLYLSQLYDSMGNVPEAYRYQTLHLELLNELESRAVRDRLAIIQGMFEAERIQAELRILENEASFAKERAELAEQFSRFMLLGLLIILGMLVWVFILYQRSSTAYIRLDDQKKQIIEQRDELQLRAAELQKANSDKNTLFSILSHDLRNLLSNAIKFSHFNGSIYLTAFRKDSYLIFSVRDEGLGMSADMVEQIHTDTFAILSGNDGTQNEKGHGVGLMLCKRLVAMNGGELKVQSYLDKGSDFHVILPIATID
ncbi:MAG: tetratricopeptide repeat protein [Bacteroidetes bacterium]|nr:tetratricopeptide repeat protein [Bacteroidota bacterium]